MKALSDFPRTTLGHLPTPLERMPRLAAELGGVPLWIKRDDCTGLAVGGNKTRKLEFLIGEALAQGADTLLTFGALQSNHVRQTAAAAARVGMACRIVLVDMVEYREPAYETSGNLLLDELLGADVYIAKGEAEVAEAVRRVVDEEAAAGRQLYVIPTGGSNAVGSLGYVECARELVAQSRELGIQIATVVTAMSSAGTQAGLVAGFAALDEPIHVVGINVYKPDLSAQETALAALVDEVAAKIETAPIARTKLCLRHQFLGDGYGVPTAAMREAVELVARCEGILLDPVYSGKAMAGLISLVRSGELDGMSGADGGAIVFLHTGGTPGLFAYRDALTGK
ncbi:MAG: D-cysteine desulfhydrase [Deltaproteobacteria bacterium]|nr:D-cysteine desulfhydrase [Deltaproteobacteria bacterium]MBW2724017.1 D-cysteine desulfhydrase [Deltaproteobacteria bacterium]